MLLPIYTTNGDVAAMLCFPYIYNLQGEWIGWLTPDRKVFSVHGHFVGSLTTGPRILRRRSYDFMEPRRTPPTAPTPVYPPDHFPLPPQMPELSLGVIDVLEEDPDLLPSLDTGEFRQDLD
jgi:hypothetical protein